MCSPVSLLTGKFKLFTGPPNCWSKSKTLLAFMDGGMPLNFTVTGFFSNASAFGAASAGSASMGFISSGSDPSNSTKSLMDTDWSLARFRGGPAKPGGRLIPSALSLNWTPFKATARVAPSAVAKVTSALAPSCIFRSTTTFWLCQERPTALKMAPEKKSVSSLTFVVAGTLDKTTLRGRSSLRFGFAAASSAPLDSGPALPGAPAPLRLFFQGAASSATASPAAGGLFAPNPASSAVTGAWISSLEASAVFCSTGASFAAALAAAAASALGSACAGDGPLALNFGGGPLAFTGSPGAVSASAFGAAGGGFGGCAAGGGTMTPPGGPPGAGAFVEEGSEALDSAADLAKEPFALAASGAFRPDTSFFAASLSPAGTADPNWASRLCTAIFSLRRVALSSLRNLSALKTKASWLRTLFVSSFARVPSGGQRSKSFSSTGAFSSFFTPFFSSFFSFSFSFLTSFSVITASFSASLGVASASHTNCRASKVQKQDSRA
mmetsp:Transcript_1408/g.2847  ORF Transcript_1408/g.2847 Transcript_1408/m.2847 type:complete len:495 (+) Transcript_1408:670-2154(+)